MRRRLFHVHDEVTDDSVAVEAENGRLVFRSIVDGAERVVFVLDGCGAALVLADALRAAFERRPSAPRRAELH
jgi:hypothetical protein